MPRVQLPWLMLRPSLPQGSPSPSRRGRLLVRALVAVGVVTLAFGSGVPAGGQSLDDLKAQVGAAQMAADAATARYEQTRARYEALNNEIEALVAEIRSGEERAAELRAISRRRAVEVYTGSGDTGVPLGDQDPLDAIRREKLLARSKQRDDAAVDELRVVNEDLGVRRDRLADRRDEEADALAALETEQRVLQDHLRAAQAAQAKLEADVAAEAAAAARRRGAAQRDGGRDYSGVFVPGGIVCPIRGPVSFIDSWGFPRGGGRRHEGVDLMSPRGTPNVAVVSGNVVFKTGSVSGLGARLFGDDGNLYYYFHLSAYAGAPRRVARGEVIGYVGNTGDASRGAPHTHFEIHPGGGGAVNPYPSVAGVC